MFQLFYVVYKQIMDNGTEKIIKRELFEFSLMTLLGEMANNQLEYSCLEVYKLDTPIIRWKCPNEEADI